MPRLVHLAPESRRKAIERGGIRGSTTNVVVTKGKASEVPRAVYAMPILPDFSVTHQWLRELRRWHDERMIAVHFVVSSDEPVWVGRYNEPHELLPLSEAARRVIAAPAGNELVLTRSIRAREVVGVRALTQLVGWTETPTKRSGHECLCVACVAPGTRDIMRRVRAAYERHVLAARTAPTPKDTVRALHMLEIPLERARGRIQPDKLFAFAKGTDHAVRKTAVALLGHFRFADVARALAARLEDDYGSVRVTAVDSLVQAGGPRRAWELISRLDDAPVIVRLVEALAYARDSSLAATLLEDVTARRATAEIRRAIDSAASDLLRDDGLDARVAARLGRLRS